jgi:hypothetical protein
MRVMMRAAMPCADGNAAIASGALAPTMQKILAELKPEAAYFTADGGERTAFLIVDMTDSSQMPAYAEPFFLAFNARVTFQPVMNAQDLANAMPAIERSVKAYAKGA